jgi:hypothetical protein
MIGLTMVSMPIRFLDEKSAGKYGTVRYTVCKS